MPYHWKVLPFGLATAPRFSTILTKPTLFHCCLVGFYIIVYLDNILVQVHSMHISKRACLFLCPLLVQLGLLNKFSKSELHLTQHFCLFGVVWGCVVYVSISTI